MAIYWQNCGVLQSRIPEDNTAEWDPNSYPLTDYLVKQDPLEKRMLLLGLQLWDCITTLNTGLL
jgi:hypothetical protein